MKKIGILTLSASDNCGSLLQCYALKKILEPYGEIEVINFSSMASHRMYDVIPIDIYRNPIRLIKRLCCLRKLTREKRGYQKFRKDYLNIKDKEILNSDLYTIADRFDVIVVGSDQVWNVCMADFDEAFFGRWASCKKVAYGPSLGGYDIRENKKSKEFVQDLKTFFALSAREEQGRICLQELTGRTVCKVLDPTLVLDIIEWRKMIGEPLVQGEYIFFYSWAYCYEELCSIVSEHSKNEQLPVYVIDSRKWISKKTSKYGYIIKGDEGPLSFLNLMYYAKICYVESFHGMIFAYLFKKNFWLLDTHAMLSEVDSRLKELIMILGVQERVLTRYNVKNVDQNSQIEYINNAFLDEAKVKSIRYIKAALEKDV